MPRWFRRQAAHSDSCPPGSAHLPAQPSEDSAAPARYLSAAPEGVRVYTSSADYIAEDRQRRGGRSAVPHDPGGWDVGYAFTLIEPDPVTGQYPLESHWRISVVAGEIYAVRVRRSATDLYYDQNPPVWLIAELPEVTNARLIENNRPLRDFLWEVEQQMRQPDSLISATSMIQERLNGQGDRLLPALSPAPCRSNGLPMAQIN